MGKIKSFNFQHKEHFEVAATKNDINFETASKVTGSRFVFLSKSFISEGLFSRDRSTSSNCSGWTMSSSKISSVNCFCRKPCSVVKAPVFLIVD